MVFYKKAEVREQKQKYGGSQKGIFALELIKAGEKIWDCECAEKDILFTRQQLLEIISEHPRLDYFVCSFSYMVDDDLYAMPYTYLEEKNNDECAYFNHSCNPNCGFGDDGFADAFVAIRDIQPGEELTCHYGALETEMSLINGLECKCYSTNCCKVLTFDYYRDPDFVSKYYQYLTPYLKKKANDAKERWYSKACYVKRFQGEFIEQIEEWEIGLCSARNIKKGEILAKFSSDEIEESKHFLKNSLEPNCHVVGRDVFANCDIPAETELSLDYHSIL